jgi:putative ABC transport system permease protein
MGAGERGPRLLLGYLVRLSVVAYHAIVRVRYRASFRDRYGPLMIKDFGALLEDAVREEGLRGVGRAWWRILMDVGTARPGVIDTGPEPGASGSNRPTGGPDPGSGRALLARTWLEDVRFAARSLRREPRFSTLLIGVLTVGIGLNVTAFSVVNAYLLRPLPYPDADRLVSVSASDAVSWSEVDGVFELAASWDLDAFTLLGGAGPELVLGAWVTPDFMEMYDVRPALGRAFRGDEAGPDGQPVVMISHGLWQRRFGGDPDVIGLSFAAYVSDRPNEAETYTVIGVLPADFWYFNAYTDVLAPLSEDQEVYAARLLPGLPLEQAEAMLTARILPRLVSPPEDFRVRLEPLQDRYVASVRPTLVALQIAVFLVLLISCVNSAVLLLLRSAGRAGEFGVRQAMGAGRTRIARQLMAEALLIAATAGVLGTAVAARTLHVAADLVAARLGRSAPGGFDTMSVDADVLAMTMMLVLIVGVGLGMVPIVSSLRRSVVTRMAPGGRGGSDTQARRNARQTMVAAEVAISLALLTGAGLMVQSAYNLQNSDPGFVPGGLVRSVVGLSETRYPDQDDRLEFFDRLLAGLRAVPGVSAVGAVSVAPFTNRPALRTVDGNGRTGEAVSVLVGQGYFAAMGTSLLAGRDFTVDDVEGSEPVAVISQSLAAHLWPGADPIGRLARVLLFVAPGAPIPEPGPYRRVVGVVQDVDPGLVATGQGQIYRPFHQAAPLWMNLMTRVVPGSGPVVSRIEAVLGDIDAEVPLSGVVFMESAVEQARAPTRFVATLLTGFAAFALLLVLLGLYGVVAYAARQRRREVAIQIALGADGRRVTWIFFRSWLFVASMGVIPGLAGGIAVGYALSDQLHGIEAGDPATLATLALALLAAAFVATWVPARRAARTDPMIVLRQE